MRKILIFLVLIIAIISLIPTAALILGSVRTDNGLAKSPPDFIPTDFTLKNYRRLFLYPVMKWFWNSVIVVVLSTVLMVTVTVTSGYGFAKKYIPAKEKIFWVMLCSMMIPGSVTFVPSFVLLKHLGLINRLAALIVPGALSVAYMFYFRQFAEKIPDEFLDMAAVDGCGEARTFLKVVLPLAGPGIATIVLLAALPKWNDFISPLLYLFDPDLFTLPLGMQRILYSDAMQKGIEGTFVPNFGLMMAGATLTFAPVIVMFLGFRKRFEKGLWGGQLK